MSKKDKAKNPTQESAPEQKAQQADISDVRQQLVLTGADIVGIGEESELLVGGKNYNTAIISQIKAIQAPQFRAISAGAFEKVLDETRLNGGQVRAAVDREYKRVDWHDPEISGDPEFLQKFVRNLGKIIREERLAQGGEQGQTKTRTFINNVVDGFATSPEGIDQLRKRSVLVQAAVLSLDLPAEVDQAVRRAYRDICAEAGEEDVPVAVRSSAAGEDSRKKAFAGLQDTYLNMVGEDRVVTAYHWDCASAYNLRSMTYRREAILDALALAEESGDDDIAIQAKKEWAIEHTSLSVCMMRMINPVISGTAFSADTATGCRGTDRKDLVSIDVSYGLGEAVVGGMVTPDKYYVFKRDDGAEVVIRQMGSKDIKIVYDEDGGGTKKVKVPDNEIYRWSLSMAHAEGIARGVRAISDSYGGMIMDSEFCIDANDQLWFVQARPETRWNEEFELHPDIIFMRRHEVDPKAAAGAEIIVEGNGASRGAGQGTVRFLRSALELNRINKGDILAAERTDPDMVPGMRVASAILADAGGDTSHAAITSRELGIPAVIGIQRVEALRALDGQEVTVDGTAGKVYRGLLPLKEMGGELDIAKIPPTKAKVGLVLADVGQSMFLSRLRNVPDFEVGLLRAEFMLGNIGVHPLALEAYDNGELQGVVQSHLKVLDTRLTQTLRGQLNAGLININIKLREYVGAITGLSEHIEEINKTLNHDGPHETMAAHRRLRELESKLDEYVEKAGRRLDLLKTTTDLEAHIRYVMGYDDELALLMGHDSETVRRRGEIDQTVTEIADKARQKELVLEALNEIGDLRAEVALRSGLQKQIALVRGIPDKIRELIRSRGYRSGKEHYVQTLSQGLALFAMAFYGKDIVYRTTDFKSNEYRNLLGGLLFEQHEDNPMLGWRGVARNLHDWELEAFKLARGVYGGTNLQLMLPFVRTLEQASSMRSYLEQVHKLKSGSDNLKIILMSEIPSNAILAKEYLCEFDGFSIGSNDMTQMVLATDRDNARLSSIYDEEDPAVIWAILVTIFTGQKFGKKVGFCGQGVSNSKIIRGLVAIVGICSASVVPDTYYQTKMDLAEIESENISSAELGQWLRKQHLEGARQLLISHNYEHILKKYNQPEELMEWYEGELSRLQEHLRESLETPKERFYRQEVEQFRKTFHKPVIYAGWDWDKTVLDALHQSGFSSFEEQAKALEEQRKKSW